MDIGKHIILVKGEDKTENISYCKYENGKWQVAFNNGKIYSYNYINVQWLKNPIILDSKTTIIYKNKQPMSGIDKIFDFGNYIRICFVSGFKKVYPKSEIEIEQSCLTNSDTNNVFKYLKQLAEKVSVRDEDESSFLSRQYAKITSISPSSVLAKYLSPTALNITHHDQMPIFPFGFNLSQKEATEKALAGQISVIEGPPGTGKTQTILNILANAVINGQTVAVVSNNNSATANVLEKLQNYGVDFIAAYLGNSENREKFFAENHGYPDMNAWMLDTASYRTINEKLSQSGKELEEMLALKNRMAILKRDLSSLSTEQEYFEVYYKETSGKITPYRSLYRHNSDMVMRLLVDYQRMAEKGNSPTLKYKLLNLLRYGIISFSFYQNTNEKVITLLQKSYYDLKAAELTGQIKTSKQRLESFHFDKAMKEYSKNSLRLFKAKLAERFAGHGGRLPFTKDILWKNFSAFNKEYPVIMSTTHSLRSCAGSNYLFDYVIMDEASQVDIVTGALALSCARKAVIVGDLKQLPNIVSPQTAEETRRIFNQFSLHKAYNYAEYSILSSITELFNDVPRTLLKEHYRCHPQIIGFCNQKFYNNELIVLTEDDNRDNPLVVYKTAEGNHARGRYNQRQIDVIMQEVLPHDINNTNQSIGIVSPYRLQTDKLTAVLGGQNIEVDTVHKYQGRERDVIILTTVVNEVNEFVDSPNLINVAVSRAVDKLIVIVSDNVRDENSNIGDLVKYIDYHNFEVIDSHIYSVFDLLYRSYSRQLFAQMKSRKKVSEYESENLMNAVIEKVLSRPEYHHLGHVMHQPLKMLIRNPELLNEEESRFAMNILTHTDFVIFNRLDKMPVLVVEVDGYAFHAGNARQLQRDRMKDTILQKYGIPVLRLKTNESGEEARLNDKLGQIMKAG